MRFLGCDISPNHSGFVLLDEEAHLLDVRFSHNMKTVVKALSRRKVGGVRAQGHYIRKKRKREHYHEFQLSRHYETYRWFRTLIESLEPSHVAVEDYAFGQGTSAYTIGEVSGLFRLIVYHSRIPFRLYTPGEIKIAAAGSGNATKSEVLAAARSRYGYDFGEFTHGSCDDVSFDLSDAFSIADLLRMEGLLRLGRVKLEDLSEKMIRVFQRTTRRSEVNILGREWIIRKTE
jgi:Holliday junction resolvasome RuvABC endonuclease subunit